MKALLAKIWAAFAVWIQAKSKAVAGALSAGIGMAISAIAGQVIAGVPLADLNWNTIGVAFITGFFAAFGIVFASPSNFDARRMFRHHRGYGYVPDVPDDRDWKLAPVARKVANFPAAVSLRSKMPPIYDQGQLGSCTANSAAAIYDYERSLQGLKFLKPSRLFIYWFTRFIEGTTGTDSGGQIRDAIKAMRLYGVIKESLWPYVITKFTTKPGSALIAKAKTDVVVKQYSVAQTASAIKTVLSAVPPRPINFGFTCYPGLESAQTASTGILPMPSGQSIGGHAVDIIGYKQINGEDYYEIRNSWGKKWGDAGHFWMPAKYILDPKQASDFWVVQAVSQNAA